MHGVRTAHFQLIFIKIGIISVSLTYFRDINSVGLRHLIIYGLIQQQTLFQTFFVLKFIVQSY